MSSKLGLVIVSAGLVLSACAPKDDKIVRPADPNAPGATVTALSSEDMIKLTFIGFDRQVEALHILKAALSADYATQKKVVAADLIANVKSLSVPGGVTDKGDSVQDGLQAIVQLDTDNTIKSVVIQDQLPKNAGTKTVNSKASLKTLVKQISVVKKDQATYDVSITAIEETNSAAGGNGSSSSFATFTISWDGKAESLNNPVHVTNIWGIGQNKYKIASFTAKSVQSDLTISLDANCAKIDGTVSLTSTKGPKKGQTNETYNLTFTDSSIAVAGKSVSYQAAACASRPVVDLSKLF